MDPQFVNELGMGRLKQMVIPSLLLSGNPGDPGNLWSPGNPSNHGNHGDPGNSGNPGDLGNPVESGMDLCNLTVRKESDECGKNVNNLEKRGNSICEICDFKTNTSKSLIKHMKMNHENKVIGTCEICGFNSTLKGVSQHVK